MSSHRDRPPKKTAAYRADADATAIEIRLDLCGLKCPLPAIKTRQALQRMAPGGLLTVLATDPLSSIDVPHAAAQAGGRLIESRREGDVMVFRLARTG
jgi:tRNA 2-thiouridine synthesizing protein A